MTEQLVQLEKVKLVFAKGRHPYSYLVRLRYQSRWSHVGIVIGDEIWEAAHPTGVHPIPIKDFIARYGIDRIDVVEAYAMPGWQERARSQEGKEYDFWGAAGLGFGTRNWADDDAWWCSEYIGFVLGTVRKDRVSRLSPEHNFMFTIEPGANSNEKANLLTI